VANGRDARAANDSLNLALLASLALHAALLLSFATHAGLRGGSQSLSDGLPTQPLSISLRQMMPQPEPVQPQALPSPAPNAADQVSTPKPKDGAGIDGGPLPLTAIAATYPEGALAMGISAKVEVHALVDEAGRVEQANVVSATLADVFDRSALAAVRDTRFVPATAAGRPVKSNYRAVIFYDLK